MNPYKYTDFENDYDSLTRRNSPKPGHAILRANNGSLGPLNLNFITGGTTPVTNIPVNQPIANVTIDTSCLDCPILLVDFAGILTATTINTAGTFTYTFTLFKTCKGGEQQPIRTFSFSQQINQLNNPDSRTLKLEHTSCDDVCDDCCQYSFELTRVSASNITTNLTVTINGVISILAVESSC